ncbi:MAG TPA: porin [Rhodanobacteraceae bacterium]
MRNTMIAAAVAAAALAGSAQAYDLEDWPTHYTFADGTDLGLVLVYRYDVNDFSDDRKPDGSHAFEDSSTNRRKELGLSLKKKGVYDAIVDYEYQGKTWLDTNVRFYSKAFFGADYGAFRFGYSKTPFSFEGNTPTKSDAFLELALPSQAMFEGRRTGVDWLFERPLYVVNVGYYWGQDLLGDNDGTTFGGRIAWTPFKDDGNVLHLGIAATREDRDATTDGRGVHHAPSVTISSPPEAGLTPVRLVSSGALSGAGTVDRTGLEALWIGGPWSVQGEWLREDVSRTGANPDFGASGGYIFGSWVLTGESRPYAKGNTDNIKPKNRWGAFELLLRYSEIDLDDAPVQGGREHDWTLGANWYLTSHFKFQANYIKAYSDKGNLSLDPTIFELRGQLMF